jgi:hypothetical protein
MIIFLMAPKDVIDYTVTDTDYWHETGKSLLLKTAYEFNNEEGIKSFPATLGVWKSYDFKYPDSVYKQLNADILMSRAYQKSNGELVWMDIINSKVGETFHKQRICVEGQGWTVNNESIAEFTVANPPNPFTKLYANRLDYSKGNEKQMMVYWFLFKKFGSNDSVTMIRLTSPVVSNETATFNSMKSFVEGNLFNAMYKGSEADTSTVAEYVIGKYGKSGILAIMVSIFVPIGLVFLGLRQRIRLKRS